MAAVASALVFVGVRATRSEGPDATSAVPALVFEDAPLAYEITYEVVSDGSSIEQRLVVERPWSSRLEDPSAVQVSDFGTLANVPVDGEPVTFVNLPSLAAGDTRPDRVLPAAVAAGLAEIGDQREIAGRRCQVYRTALPLDGGPVVPAADDDAVESCVDRVGLVLEEVHRVGGEVVLRRTAVRVATDTTGIDHGPVPEPGMTIEEGGVGLREISEEEADALDMWRFEAPPNFIRRGHYAAVHPDQTVTEDPLAAFSRVSSVISVWTRGPDVIIVENGGTLDGSDVELPAGGTPHEGWPPGAETGSTRLYLGGRGNELRHTADGTFVRLLATVDPDELLELSRWLVPPAATP